MGASRWWASLGASVLILGLSTPSGAEVGPGAADPETVTAAPLDTWQTDAPVYDIEIVDGVAYVAGSFTKVRPPGAAPGTNEVDRAHLAAFDARTGDLLPWAPDVTAELYELPPGETADTSCTPRGGGAVECATVWSLAATPDKSTLIAGGDFTRVDGKYRLGSAAFSLATGDLLGAYRPSANGRVYAVAGTNDAAFLGGSFTEMNGKTRKRLASVDLSSGDVLPFAPDVAPGTSRGVKSVRAIALTEDESRLIVGGGFDRLNNTSIHGLGAVDATTGQTARFDARRIDDNAYVTSVNVHGNTAYSTADVEGSLSEGVIAYNATTGAEKWYDSCRGGSHSTTVVRGVVYAGSHAHDCGVMDDAFGEQYFGYAPDDRRRYTLRAEVPAGQGRARLLHWYPRTNDGNGPFAMATDGDSLWVGGEFTTVDNSVPQQGLTRFAFLDAGGENRKPLKPATPVVTSTTPGVVDISWQQTEDPDQRSLRYHVYRDGDTGNPIHTVVAEMKPWLKGWLSVRDTGLAPGTVHTYDVRAIDPMGARSSRSPQATVTVAAATPRAADLPRDDNAVSHYSYESLVGGRFRDNVANRPATPGTGVDAASGSAASGNALRLSGQSGGSVIEDRLQFSSRSFSIEALFRTSTNRGGVIASLGTGANPERVSSKNVGNLYLDDQGRVNWGVIPDEQRTDVWANPSRSKEVVTTTESLNDGSWHHVVGTFQPATGLRIFVDGALVASQPEVNWSRAVEGHFRVGGDRVAGWPNRPASAYLKGRIDEAALYLYPLTKAQVSQHAASMLELPEPAAPFDFDGDGRADMAVGVPGEDLGGVRNAGAVQVLYGSSSGPTARSDFWHQNSAGIKGVAEAHDRFGSVLDSGDLDRDGYADLAIGIPREDRGGNRNTGQVQVLYGGPGGLTARDEVWHQGTSGVAGGNESGDRFGESLAVGDVDRDGFADLVIGVAREDLGSIKNAGRVALVRGSRTGLTATGSQSWSQATTGIASDPGPNERFGADVAAGDVTGDGYADVVAGVTSEEDTGGDSGSSLHLLPGGSSGLDASASQTIAFGDVNLPRATRLTSLRLSDVNADGRDDLTLGTTESNFPSVVLLHGHADGFRPAPLPTTPQPGKDARWPGASAVAAGDFTGDGPVDLVLDGATLVIGTSQGLGSSSVQWPDLGASTVRLNALPLSGGSHAWLIAGLPDELVRAEPGAGKVTVMRAGGSGALSTVATWHQDSPGLKNSAEAFDGFGDSVG